MVSTCYPIVPFLIHKFVDISTYFQLGFAALFLCTCMGMTRWAVGLFLPLPLITVGAEGHAPLTPVDLPRGAGL